MNQDNKAIITEDGQRLEVKDGLITGTEAPKEGLAYETGNVLDEPTHSNNEDGGACPAKIHQAHEETRAQETSSENMNR